MPQLPGYEMAARWQSAREVAGDFYDLFALSDDTMGVVIADVSDKGAPAALFMASARSMIRSHALAGFSPFETLSRTNDMIVDDSQRRHVCHGLLQPVSGGRRGRSRQRRA